MKKEQITQHRTDADVNLDAFIQAVHKDLLVFKSMWVTGHDNVPEHFPMKMPIGAWYEQFNVFETAITKPED